eukprot:gnl/TRDRNA2_/TRDRNA2_195242_c0_seq1.p1 gnl/TRDRNA2_/TRDRNA2_195242_c0~~gnl/TRDRNA2_/TRDRNA2_195242_c0_seq1.p1  ORF type:complete len:296 (-),score=78.03 gnl/TRDRNA2_/TRDRNA2_195242_c0_seq1:89-976(-)
MQGPIRLVFCVALAAIAFSLHGCGGPSASESKPEENKASSKKAGGKSADIVEEDSGPLKGKDKLKMKEGSKAACQKAIGEGVEVEKSDQLKQLKTRCEAENMDQTDCVAQLKVKFEKVWSAWEADAVKKCTTIVETDCTGVPEMARCQKEDSKDWWERNFVKMIEEIRRQEVREEDSAGQQTTPPPQAAVAAGAPAQPTPTTATRLFSETGPLRDLERKGVGIREAMNGHSSFFSMLGGIAVGAATMGVISGVWIARQPKDASAMQEVDDEEHEMDIECREEMPLEEAHGGLLLA